MAMTDDQFNLAKKRLADLTLRKGLLTKDEEAEFLTLRGSVPMEMDRRRFIVSPAPPTVFGSPMPAIIREAKAKAQRDTPQHYPDATEDPEEKP